MEVDSNEQVQHHPQTALLSARYGSSPAQDRDKSLMNKCPMSSKASLSTGSNFKEATLSSASSVSMFLRRQQ